MKYILVLITTLFILSSCTKTEEGKDVMVFEIPETYTEIVNSDEITVNGEVVKITGDRLEIGDTVTDVIIDQRADFFDQVGTGSISDYSGYKLIETVPSLDTPVCTMQTKQLEFAASEFSDVNFIVISNDTPFALQRFCSANSIENLEVFSDARTREFGARNGLLLEDYSLLTRSIMIVDADNVVLYIEYADEVTSELDLMNALAFLKSVAQ